MGSLLSPGMWRILASTLFLSLNGVFIKFAGQEAHVLQIVFVRSLAGLALCMVFAGGDVKSQVGVNRRLLALRGFIGVFAMLFTFYAFTALPVAEATVIFFVNPVFVSMLAWPFLRERMTGRKLACVAASFSGVLLVAQPGAMWGAASGLPLLGVAAALGGSFFSAGTMVVVRAIGTRERALAPIFYLNAFTVAAVGGFAAACWTWGSWGLWANLLAIGLLTHLGQYCMTRGLSMESAGRGSAVGYFQIVFAIIWGMLFFSEYPDLLALAGAAVIMAGTLGLRERPKGAPNS
ncbi:MAG: DMT family transporter [Desulfovibrionaceae bacterium]